MLRTSHMAALAGIITFAALPTIAQADMGRAPVSGGIYVSGDGGYLYQDGADVIGHGISYVPGTVVDIQVSPEDGWFAGGMAGFENGRSLITGLPFTRIEFYGLFGKADDSRSDLAPPLSDIRLESVDGLTNIGGIVTSISANTSIERRFWEGGIRLESDQTVDSSLALTWVLAPFIREAEEETVTTVVCCGVLQRSGDVDTSMYGVFAAVEPEMRLTSFVSLVGRLGAGVYGYNADGAFRSSSTGLGSPDPFFAQVSDSDSGVGFRGLLGAGLKFKLSSATNFETFAEADYFSDVASAQFSSNSPANRVASRVTTDDLWDLRVGGRLTIGFGGAN